MTEALTSTTDPVSQGLVAVLLVVVFALLAMEAAHRVLVALGAVAVLWLVTYTTRWHLITFDGMGRALDFNVLMLLAAMMALVGVLRTTGIFEVLVTGLLRRARGRPVAVLGLVVWGTALLSAFLDNVTTVVFMTPVALGLCRRLGVRPEAVLLPMIMASNIGGTATLIGDPPNIMIGSAAGISFVAFLADLAAPCMVMLGWLLWFSRRRYATALPEAAPGTVLDFGAEPGLHDRALLGWMALIGGGVLAGFLTHHVTGMPAAVPATIGAAAALIVQDRLYLRRHRPTAAERTHGVLAITERDIEWPTLAFFGLLFIIVGAAVETGLIATLATGLQQGIAAGAGALHLSPRGTLLLAALAICWTSGVLSALVDNIPFVAVAIPIVARLAGTLPGEPMVLWWALSLGSCLGGNGSPIGASANVTTLGLAEREGSPIGFASFARYGVVVTAGTLAIASAWLAAFAWLGRRGALLASLAAVGVLLVSGVLRPAPTVSSPATG